MRHESPQPGNPHQLTIDQHVLPRRSIARFAESGMVEVTKLPFGSVRRLHPKHETFCATRVWDQKAETVGSHRIEENFQLVADAVIRGLRSFGGEQNAAISEMFFLWRGRFEAMEESREDLVLNGITGEELSKDSQEFLERSGVTYLLPGGRLPRRFFNGIRLRRKIDRDLNAAGPIQWGVIEATAGEFIVPDTTAHYLLMPISPTIFLGGGSANVQLAFEGVAETNSLLRSLAVGYYFARQLNACPIRKLTLPWTGLAWS